MDKAVEAVVEAIRAASPALWAAAQAKVQSDLAVAQFWQTFCGVTVALSLVLIVVGIFLARSYDWEVPGGLLVIVSLFSAIFSTIGVVANHATIIAINAAPQWYAIKALVELSPLK